jgi:hypothetical protein
MLTTHSQNKNYLQILFPILVDSSVQEQNNTKATFSKLGSYEASKITEIVKFTASQRSPVDKHTICFISLKKVKEIKEFLKIGTKPNHRFFQLSLAAMAVVLEPLKKTHNCILLL